MNPTDSTITTQVQRALGQRLIETAPHAPLRPYTSPRTTLHGVEVPVTLSGRY